MTEQPWRGVWREAVLLVLVVLAALRLLTVAHDQWGADEVLLVEAVRKGVDVRLDRPPAPGSPLFVAMARALTELGAFPFQAARTVGALGSYLAALGIGFLLLALSAPGIAALLGTLLYALIPAVWLHGGRPGAEGFTAAAFLFGAGFFVRSLRSSHRSRDFLLGAACLTVAAGLKPEVALALLPVAGYAAFKLRSDLGGTPSGFTPAPSGTAMPLARTLAISLAVLVIASAVFWRPTIRSSGGWPAFRERIEARYAQQHIEGSGLEAAPHADHWGHRLGVPEPSLEPGVWLGWFRRPFGNDTLFTVVALLSAAGLLAARRAGLPLVLIFAPLLLVTLPFGPLASAPRTAAMTLPLLAGLAALALERLGHRWHWPGAIVSTALLGALAATGLPAVVAAAAKPSPPAALASSLRAVPGWQGRPLAFDRSLALHVTHLLQGVSHRELRDGEAGLVGRDELVATAGEPLFGVEPDAVFGTPDEAIATFSGLRPLTIRLYASLSSLGVVRAHSEGDVRFDAKTGDVLLAPKATLTLEGLRGPVRLSAEAQTTSPSATLRAETSRGAEAWGPSTKVPVAVTLVLTPDEEHRLVRFTAAKGHVRLARARLTSLAALPASALGDPRIPCAVDEPGEDADVRAPLVVKGWCQEEGGGLVTPSEFRIDGVLVRPDRIERVPRHDLLGTFPYLGDASQAGFVATFSSRAVPRGQHSLVIAFVTPDGRRKVLPARRFGLSP